MMENNEIQMLIARYPFLPQAKERLAALATSRVGIQELERARRRALDSVNLVSENGPDEAASYALARMLLHVIGSDYYWGRFARGEAAAAAAKFRAQTPDERLKAAVCLFPSLVIAEDGSFEMSVVDFLSNGGELPLASVKDGAVKLSDEGLVMLFRKAAYRRIAAPVSIPTGAPVPDLFKREAEELRGALPAQAQAQRSSFKGKYLSLPCIQNAINNTPEGKRYYACLSICIACRKDGLSRAEAEQVMQTFVSNCGKSTHEFTLREAMATLQWVFRRDINFSCKMQRAHGLATPGICGKQCVLDRRGRF